MVAEEELSSETQAFIPDSGGMASENGKYKVSVIPARKQTESIQLEAVGQKLPYDPFKERSSLNRTTDLETFVHLLKASLGTGILSMPYAFRCAGFSVGLLSTVITAFVCTYCSYILVKCAHTLYYKARVNTLSYADVAEVAFANGPVSLRKYAKTARMSVMSALFITYFGAISCYAVIVGMSFQEVIEYYSNYHLNIRVYILAVLPPLVILGFIPNLKALAPFSFAANVLISIGLGIAFYYLVFDMAKPWDLRQVPESLGTFTQTFSITVFAMEAIGLMMPLENNMQNPTHFLGISGVLTRGMSIVSLVYIMVGCVGYMKYGEKVQANIISNLPVNEIAPQIAKICIGVSVLLTYVLQYFVCLEIAWNGLKDKFEKRASFYNKIVRAVLVSSTVLLAVAVPDIGPLVSLIGALCFSFLGILFPIFIEIVTYWDIYSITKILVRNSLVILFGLMALCFGTYTSLQDIIKIYLSSEVTANLTQVNTTNGVSQ